MTAAYYSGAWSNGAKIRLGDVLVKPGESALPANQTPDEHIAAMDKWVIVTGGTLDAPAKGEKRRKSARRARKGG